MTTEDEESVDNLNYKLPKDAETTFAIKKAESSFQKPEAVFGLIYSGEAQDLLSAGQTEDGKFVYKVNDGERSENIPSGLDAGTYTVTAAITDGNYGLKAEGASAEFVVAKADLALSVSAVADKTYGDPTFSVAPETGDTEAVVKYVSNNEDVASVDENGVVTIKNAGETTITLEMDESGNYTGTRTWIFVVAPVKTEQIKENGDGSVKIGEGTLSFEVKTEGGAPTTTLGTSKVEIIDMLIQSGDITADELAEIANGATVDIILIVSSEIIMEK